MSQLMLKESEMSKSKLLANHEIEWWKAHHRNDNDKLLDEMAQLYALQFDISYDQATEAVKHRVEAAKWHDIAEACEDKGDQEQADIYWQKAEESLQVHFAKLLGTTNHPR